VCGQPFLFNPTRISNPQSLKILACGERRTDRDSESEIEFSCYVTGQGKSEHSFAIVGHFEYAYP
jgi:hypothetical protein